MLPWLVMQQPLDSETSQTLDSSQDPIPVHRDTLEPFQDPRLLKPSPPVSRLWKIGPWKTEAPSKKLAPGGLRSLVEGPHTLHIRSLIRTIGGRQRSS